MEESTKKWLLWVVGSAIIACALVLMLGKPVHAADLGSQECCSDLEDRIAELEATTATKGNRKISVTIYGEVSEAIYHFDGFGVSKNAVGENSNAESFVGIQGEAVVLPKWHVGYVLEIGVGGSDGVLGAPFQDSNGTYTRRSYGYVKSDDFGKVSVGLASQATEDITQYVQSNTTVAARMLSIRPLVGAQVGEALDIYDGNKTNLVRYDSPTLLGATLSASWATGGINGFTSTGDVWDIALRWHGEAAGFTGTAALGYRNGIVIPTIGNVGSISYAGFPCFGTCVDPKIISGSTSIKHTATGLFANFAAGDLDLGGAVGNNIDHIVSWTTQAGAEEHWVPLGLTTVYGEYADVSDDHINLGLKYWGAGIVQHIDAAAMDGYISFRQYDIDNVNDSPGTLVMGGILMKF